MVKYVFNKIAVFENFFIVVRNNCWLDAVLGKSDG